jgi:hypothetical protein
VDSFSITVPDWAPLRLRGLVIQFGQGADGPTANVPEASRELTGSDISWITRFVNLVLDPLGCEVASTKMVFGDGETLMMETIDFPPGLLGSLGYEDEGEPDDEDMLEQMG